MAVVETVHAGHATTIVDHVVLRVDARCLALAGAHATSVALREVDVRFQQREACQETQDRPHRTDRVAIGAAITPSQHRDYYQADQSHHEGTYTFNIGIHPIESIAVRLLSEIGQEIISCLINRCEQVGGDAAIRTIGGQQGHQGTDTRQTSDHENGQHDIAKDRLRRRVAKTELFLFALSTHPRDHILHHAQRTDHRAIDTPQEQGQDHQSHNHAHIQRIKSRPELDLGHPAKPSMDRPREVEEQQGDQHKENRCGKDSYFSKHKIILLFFTRFNHSLSALPQTGRYDATLPGCLCPADSGDYTRCNPCNGRPVAT